MREFFGQEVLLGGESAKALYEKVKDLPIIDYHCHLDQEKIAADAGFENIGELWLAGDHYKWRAMRMCGVDEFYVTGKASWEEKFEKYAEILPNLMGGPLYYWTHLELKQVLGITLPLNKATAKEIYRTANEKLKTLSVRALLKRFNVQFVATTNDPVEDLHSHGVYGDTLVSPTFRPDKLYDLNEEYLEKLSKAAGVEIRSLADVKAAVCKRLDFYKEKGCRISDHGFFDFPKRVANETEANALFARRGAWTTEEKEAVFGHILLFLLKEYKKRDITVQLHFSVTRNVNTPMFEKIGVDAGYDVMSGEPDFSAVVRFLDLLPDEERPRIILYTLNPNAVAPLACISGAFRNVYIGAAWWFNDTLLGIRKNLETVAEYACLGTNLGMLTDSRSFSSYSRFDFFRRILCSYVGEKVDAGEYNASDAEELVKNICYYNVKNLLKI